MKAQEELVAVLQVGTRRATLPEVKVLAEFETQSSEKRALVMSGVLDLMSRAGTLPLEGIPSLEASPQEDAPFAMRSAQPLCEAIDANLIDLVLDWAAKANHVGKVAPPAALVKLLTLVQKHKQLIPTLGQRGRWLATLHGLDLEADASGDLQMRRAADPDSYRNWLETDLDTMDWRERANAILVMRQGLSLADETLLEKALKDRRKEVREPACELLMSLEQSRVARELLKIAQEALTFEKSLLRSKLNVNPPDPASLPKWLPKTPSRIDFGPKALALFDVIRYLPPSRWSLGIPPEQILDLAAKTDYAKAIHDGLKEAAVRYADQVWIDEVFEFIFGLKALSQEYWADLAHHVSEDVFERRVSMALLVFDPLTAACTLALRKKPLSLALSRAAITTLRTHVEHHYRLREIAPYLHPATLSIVDAQSSEAEPFESTRQYLHKILNFRHRLLSSLDD